MVLGDCWFAGFLVVLNWLNSASLLWYVWLFLFFSGGFEMSCLKFLCRAFNPEAVSKTSTCQPV